MLESGVLELYTLFRGGFPRSGVRREEMRPGDVELIPVLSSVPPLNLEAIDGQEDINRADRQLSCRR
jgi:hypothetical protein